MKEETSRKEKKEKVEWDKLKIALFVVLAFILLFAGYEIKSITLDKNSVSSNPVVEKSVSSKSIIGNSSPNIKNTIQDSISGLKKEATSINIADIATSSPQIQKVINDLKGLQNYPSSELKNACLKICNGL